MGPNSRGGTRNKDNNNPTLSTRNRFSNWKPPTKNQKEKFVKQHEDRNAKADMIRGEEAAIRKPAGGGGRGSGSISVPNATSSGKRSSGTTGQGQGVGELVSIPPAVLQQLLSIFEPEQKTEAANVPNKAGPANAEEAVSNRGRIVVCDTTVPPVETLVHHLSDTKPRSELKATAGDQPSGRDAPERRKARNILSYYGFEATEVSDLLSGWSELPARFSELELLLSALLAQCGSGKLAPLSAPTKDREAVDLSLNGELLCELDILSSIYGQNVVYRSEQLLGTACCVIDVSVPVEGDVLPSALAGGGDHYLHMKLFISNVESYPAASAPLYGWVVPPSSSGPADRDGLPGTTPVLSVAAARQLSQSAMAHIRSYQAQSEAPAAFEFIQHVRDGLASALAAHPAKTSVDVDTSAPGGAATSASDKVGGVTSIPSAGGGANRKTAVAVELPRDAAVEGPPPMPPKPMTNHMQGTEYRTALGAALSAGLIGAAARAKAHSELEFVLPKSTLDALRIEEAYHEECLNRTCSLDNLSTRTVIDATRLLSEELQVNKAKAKALIGTAKDTLVAQRDYFARSEDQMRNKLVTCAVGLFRERLRRKEEKKQQATGKRKAPGLTLRDAFARRRAREQAAAAADVPPEDSTPVRTPPPEPEPEQEWYDEDGDDGGEAEVEEEAPLDPAQVAAAQAAAREKQRQLNLESAQLQKRFREKQRLPKYRERVAQRSTLPSYAMKDAIVEAINSHSVTVISGDTGCGKTTQVPQFVLDDWMEKGRGAECSIIVTQPRRISAMSVAERIAFERVEQVGQTAGYHIRLEVKKGPGTRLLLMTTGVLLRMLQMEGNLEGISHVFVDEVHERDLNTDFLLIVLKKLLAFRPDLKIVLMSATLNAKLFLDYFRNGGAAGKKGTGGDARAGISSCTMLSIPGRTFPVTSYYLEDAFQVTNFEFPPTSPCLAAQAQKGRDKGRGGKGPGAAAAAAEEKRLRRAFIESLRQSRRYSEKTVGNLELVEESVVNAELIVKLVQHIVSTDQPVPSAQKEASEADPSGAAGDGALGAILIFLPGLANIQDVVDALKASPLLCGKHAPPTRVLPLHSSLSPQEQNAVFQKMPPGHRKIVVSTNIAETSVTIEDVVYVIDTCRVKENSYDEASHMNVLEEMWASKANCRQRRGRAGRVRAGVCYHLVSRFTMDRLPDYMTPEMQKMSLEDTILQILALDLGNPYQFLRSALSPPEDVAITNGVLYLEGLSAVVVNNFDTSLNVEGKDIAIDLDCEITPLGYHLAALPINPRIGKLILYGVLLHCIDPILTIASTESVKSVFTSPFGAKELADEAKLRFLDGNSDLLTSANAFSTWKTQYDKGSGAGAGGPRDGPSEGEFCRINFLGMNSLRLVDQMRQQFLNLLKDIGFMPAGVTLANIRNCPQNSYGRHTGMIKCAICAGLSPNILLVPDLATKNAGKKLAEISLQSRAQGTMKVHPASVMSEAKSLDSGYIVYLEAMRTSQVYVRDVTTIPALTLAMFSGRSKVNPYSGAVVVDGWLRFRTPNLRIASCIARIRDCMEDAFMQKVLEPASETSPKWNAVLRCIENTVAST